MAKRTRTILKTFFETGDIPTEAEFIDLIDSDLNTTDDDTTALTEGTDKKFVTDAEKVVIGNTSGTNTGDQSITPEGTAVLSTGETGATKFLREDGDGTSSWQAVPGGGGSAESTTYDDSGLTTGNLVADKTNVQTAEEETRAWINEPGKALGTFTPAMTFASQGQYTDYVQTGAIELTATGVIPFQVQVVRITADGVNDITFGAGIDKLITQFTNPLEAGAYWFYMASFISPGGSGAGVHVSIPEVQAVPDVPPIVLSMTVEDANPSDLVVEFNESVTATNIGYTFRVDTVDRSLSAVSGSGTTFLTFTISGAAIETGESLDLSYSIGTGDTTGSQSELESFTQQPVTNNVAGAFVNTHSMVIDSSGEGMTVDDTNLYFSDGAGTDLPNTILFWFKTPGTITNFGEIFRISDINNNYIKVFMTTANGFNIRYDGASANCDFYKGGASLTIDTWYMVGFSRTEGDVVDENINFVINDVSQFPFTVAAGGYDGLPASVAQVYLEYPYNSGGFAGLGKHNLVRILDKKLSVAEMQLHTNGVIPLESPVADQSNIVCEYRFNQNLNAAYGTNGTEVGTPTYDTDLPT